MYYSDGRQGSLGMYYSDGRQGSLGFITTIIGGAAAAHEAGILPSLPVVGGLFKKGFTPGTHGFKAIGARRGERIFKVPGLGDVEWSGSRSCFYGEDRSCGGPAGRNDPLGCVESGHINETCVKVRGQWMVFAEAPRIVQETAGYILINKREPKTATEVRRWVREQSAVAAEPGAPPEPPPGVYPGEMPDQQQPPPTPPPEPDKPKAAGLALPLLAAAAFFLLR